GIILLARRSSRLAMFLTLAIAAEMAAFHAARPLASMFPIVAARYTIVALPAAMMLLAVGLAAQLRGLASLFRRESSVLSPEIAPPRESQDLALSTQHLGCSYSPVPL